MIKKISGIKQKKSYEKTVIREFGKRINKNMKKKNKKNIKKIRYEKERIENIRIIIYKRLRNNL